MIEIFNTLLSHPLFNILIFLYNFVPPHDLGISVIILTVLVRILISPMSIKAARNQRIMAVLQPKLKEIQEKHKGDAQKQNEEIRNLYKEAKTNPFSGCLPLLIQLPIFIALFQILKDLGNDGQFSALYSFVQRPEAFNTDFLGILDLSKSSKVLAIAAGIFQFVQSKMISSFLPKTAKANQKNNAADDMSRIMTQQMTYIMPIFLIVIYWSLPSVLSLYWIVITLFSIGEQYYINKKIKI